jgi:hypothetical protein
VDTNLLQSAQDFALETDIAGIPDRREQRRIVVRRMLRRRFIPGDTVGVGILFTCFTHIPILFMADELPAGRVIRVPVTLPPAQQSRRGFG